MNLVFHSFWKKPLGFEGVVCGFGAGNARPYQGGWLWVGVWVDCWLACGVGYGWRDLIDGGVTVFW